MKSSLVSQEKVNKVEILSPPPEQARPPPPFFCVFPSRAVPGHRANSPHEPQNTLLSRPKLAINPEIHVPGMPISEKYP